MCHSFGVTLMAWPYKAVWSTTATQPVNVFVLLDMPPCTVLDAVLAVLAIDAKDEVESLFQLLQQVKV